MLQRRTLKARRGAVLPLVALCMVALIGLMALAIDIGMVAVARSQCQNAADSGAMAGARTMSGNSTNNYNLSAVPGQALTAASTNQVMNNFVSVDLANVSNPNASTYSSGQVTVEVGSYAYIYNDADPSKEGFQIAIPRTDTAEPYSTVRTTVTSNSALGFGRVFGMSTFNASATATAVHRPRDVMIIMDLSGSMRFQSLPGTPMSGSQAAPSSGNARTRSLNPESVFPQYGHYSDISGAALQKTTGVATTTNEFVDPSNISSTQNSGPPICADFYQNAVGVQASAANVAFTRASDAYNTAPGGDDFLKVTLDAGASYAQRVYEFNSNSSTTNPKFETKGYGGYRASYNGYTQGPGYWGKTFWIWPPAPRGPSVLNPPSSITNTSYAWHNNQSLDWRQRFFVAVNTSTSVPSWVNHNTILFDSTGLKAPGTNTTVTENGSNVTYTYRINYAAILYWLNGLNPKPFPSTLQGGRIRYYSAIPDGTDTTLNNRWWTTATTSLANDQRFWKEYIDFVLGFTPAAGANSYNRTIGGVQVSALIGNGDYFTPTGYTYQISQRPQPQPSPSNPGAPYTSGTTGAHQSGSTSYYENSTTSAKASVGATTVPVNSLASAPVANQNYATFANNTASPYKITNSSKTSLNISPALGATMPSSTTVQVYASNNAVGVTAVSLSGLTSATTANSDYVGFKSNTTNLYQVTNSSTSSLSLSTALVSALALTGDSVQVYASNGAVGATKISVTGLSQAPTVNRDYMVIAGDTANPYLITAVSTFGSNYVLTISPGLASAVKISGATVDVYSPYMDYKDNPVRPRHQFWFGPMTMVDWLGNYNLHTLANSQPHHWWPGNVHEAHAWACKVGIQTAIDDIKNNHPNDFVGLTFFSNPKTSNSGSGHH
ncbi:MAG: hypothetical protein HY040_11120, partial [Planctomycetes bacterium]|nr:hypothetical protein [Planctomycetota bacterium]